MIKYKKIDIKSPGDFDSLLHEIDPIYINGRIVEEFKKKLSVTCKSIIIEYPYRDVDFSSTYSGFHSKKHKFVPKECYRLHLFFDESLAKDKYGGFIVLRPSYVENRGRAHIHPKMLIDSKSYLMLSSVKAHILGEEYTNPSFPWMSQETDIAVCAHISVWSVIRYFSQKFHRFNEYTMHEIVELTPQYIQRKTPSEGLNILQIAETFSRAGYHPLMLRRQQGDPSKFIGNIFSYIESGIPIIGIMTNKEHAVSIIGHGELQYSFFDSMNQDYIHSHELIDSLIVCDDNHLPYTKIMKTSGTSQYSFDDLDFAIVPLYEKMFLSSDIMRERVLALLKTNNLTLKPPIVLRTYMTSSNSLKEKVSADSAMTKELALTIIRLPMPKFVWCVEISSKDEFKMGKISGKIIIDVTAGTYEHEPWLLFHDTNMVKYFDSSSNKFFLDTFAISPYSFYKHNLKEV